MTLVKEMVEYLMWANSTIWRVVESLKDDEYERRLADGAGSIRSRYVHLAEDTWEWFNDWHGKSPTEPDFGMMKGDELYQFIEDYLRKWQTLVEKRTINEFVDERAGKRVSIKFDEIIFHLVNHFTYHRGQIAMGLRILGKEVPMTDYVPYRFAPTL
ncbi:MAG: DinB family protein [Candidatus Thorarchaeota archaeon]